MSTKSYRSTKVDAVVKSVLGTTVAVPLMFSASAAMAQGDQMSPEQMQQEMQQMQQELDELKGHLGNKPVSEATQTLGGTTFEFSGYVKFDAIYDLNDDHGVSLGPSDAIATYREYGTDDPNRDNLGATASQSRVVVDTTTPTAIGDVGGHIEADFYGNGFEFDDSPGPRIRRAFLTYGNWTFGRDWTTFSDFNYGTSLNFFGPQNQIFERQAQIRYTFNLANDDTLDVALEDPNGGSITTGSADVGFSNDVEVDSSDVDQNQLPDFVIRYQGSAGPVSYQVAGLARQIKANLDTGKDSVFGWGLDAGGSWELPTGTTLMATLSGGKGIGKYLYAPAGGSDAYVKSNGDIEAFERYGFTATISQAVTDQVAVNLDYGEGFSENPDNVSYSTGGFHDHSQTMMANVLYTPVDPLTFGIEYSRVTYEQQDGVDADANSVQVSAIYNF